MTLAAPDHIRGRLAGSPAVTAARLAARREWIAAHAHHGPAAVAAALGLSRETIRNQYHKLFHAAPPAPRAEKPAKDVTAVVYERHMASSSAQAALRVNLPRLPWDAAERGPDARHETAPRDRTMASSTPSGPVDDLARIICQIRRGA